MKKILLSLVVIVAVAAIAGGATYAVFSSTDSINNNTIATATVKLDAHNLSGNKPIGTIPVVGGLVPGQWTSDGPAELYNQSSVAVKVYMYVDEVTGGACGKTNLEVKTGYAGGDEQIRTIYSGALNSIAGSSQRVEVTGNPPFATIPANWTQVIHQRAQLDSSADNSYQNTSCTWNEYFVAENI